MIKYQLEKYEEKQRDLKAYGEALSHEQGVRIIENFRIAVEKAEDKIRKAECFFFTKRQKFVYPATHPNSIFRCSKETHQGMKMLSKEKMPRR